MTFRRLLLAGAAAVLAPLGVITLVQAQSAGRQPDAKHGAVIVAQGTAAGSPPCAQCHAFNGVSDASGAFPRLAGQSAYYLARQLRDFASGGRASAIMSPIAKALSPDDVADVSADGAEHTVNDPAFGSAGRSRPVPYGERRVGLS